MVEVKHKNRQTAESAIPTEREVVNTAISAWQERHSAGEILDMYDDYLGLQAEVMAARGESYSLGAGSILNSLSQFAVEADGLDHTRLIFGAMNLFTKHNPQRSHRVLVLAFFASDLKAKGLKKEGEHIARMLQKSDHDILDEIPELKEVVEGVLED